MLELPRAALLSTVPAIMSYMAIKPALSVISHQGQQWSRNTKNSNFQAKSAVFWPRIAIMSVCRKSFSTSSQRNPLRFLFLGRAWYQMGQKDQYLAKNDQKYHFGPKLAVFKPILAKLLLCLSFAAPKFHS